MANPSTVGTAIILEELGYLALGTSSAALARAMGRQDGCRAVARHEAIAHAELMASVTTIPISGDFENGYGDAPADVAETVRASIAAGLAGCCIEDATGLDDPVLYDSGLAVDRIAAGADAIGEAPFMLVARCENYLFGRNDLAATIGRLQSFEAAGAGAVYAPGLTTIDEIRAIVESVGVPVNVLVGLAGQSFTLDDLREIGVRRVSVGSGFERAATQAVRNLGESLLSTNTPLGPLFNG